MYKYVCRTQNYPVSKISLFMRFYMQANMDKYFARNILSEHFNTGYRGDPEVFNVKHQTA